MKRIIIVRHAKSDWTDGSIRDFDRPLNERGVLSAPAVGREIKSKALVPDLIISSPALRAKMTALAVAESSGYNQSIIWNESFYFGYTGEIMHTLKGLQETVQSVMIFGHNPTWSSLAELLTGKFIELSTADAVVLEYIGFWKDLKNKSCKQTIYISSKDLI
jgi:phosphohistidine phosphatase